MEPPVTFDINFRRLLCSICTKFSLPPPKYGITLGSEDRLCSYVDVVVPICSRLMEVITCWGSPSIDSDETEEDAARVAVETLSKVLNFEIRDANFKERKKVQNLYDCISQKYEDLRTEYDILKEEHNVLKEIYGSLIDEKNQLCANWNGVKAHLDSCWNLYNQSGTVPMEAEASTFAEACATVAGERVVVGEAHTSPSCSIRPKTMAALASSPETEEDPEAPPGYYANFPRRN